MTSRTLQTLLDERRPLPAPEALALLRGVAARVLVLHDAGRIHRGLHSDRILLDPPGETWLEDAEALRRLEGAEELPPEALSLGPIAVPDDIEQARALFRSRGLEIDPRRVDVYQLGVLLCRLLTGEPPSAYLRSPRVKAKVPAETRPLLDAALGHDPAVRLTRIEAATWGLPSGGQTTLLDTVPPHPAAGTRLGRYRLVRRLGGGGMGDVYLAHDEELGREVALKVLPTALAGQAAFVERFRNEARAAGRLRHPHIVPVYEAGQEGASLFYVMPYVEGGSLEERLEREGSLDIPAAINVLEQVLLALQEAHAAGFVHRDVKPGNILLERGTGRALLADFGLVKNLRAGRGLTMTGAVLGTLKYIAPEQARGKHVDARADLYSLGIVAYRMLSGRHPFEAPTPQAMMLNHLAGQAPPLVETAPHVPGELQRIVQRLMEREVENRYPSAAAALVDLQRFQAAPVVVRETVSTRPLPPVARGSTRRARRRMAVLALSLLALAVLLSPSSKQPAKAHPVESEKVRDLVGHRGPVLAAVFSPTGERAYTASEDGTILAWEIATGRELFRMTGHASGVLSLAISPDGRRLLSGSRDRTVRLWNAETGQQEKQLAGVTDPCWGLSFTRDGGMAIVASEANGVRLFSVDSGKQFRHYQGHWANAVAAGPTVRNFLTGGKAGKLLYWYTGDPSRPKVLAGHEAWIRAVALSPDGKYAATCSGNAALPESAPWPGDDCTVRWWDVSAGKELACLKGHTNTVADVAIVPGKRRVVSVSADRTLRLWDVESGREVRRWQTAAGLLSVAVSPDGRLVLTGATDGTVSLWRLPVE